MDWQPIETAEQTREDRLFLLPNGERSVGYWDFDRYATKVRPFWSCEIGYLRGKLWMRTNQPTHWMPLPAPPHA